MSGTASAMELVKRANSKQVGGDHYKTGGIEHWDLFGPEYLMGCATKYVSRWRKKNGLQDLEKAAHYVDKLLEVVAHAKRPSFEGLDYVAVPEAMEAWARNLGLDYVEVTVITRIMYWRERSDLVEARRGIEYLIQCAPSVPTVFTGPVRILDERATEEINTIVRDYTNLRQYDEQQIRDEIARLQQKNSEAPAWGAAVGARAESIKALNTELARRALAWYEENTPSCGDGSFDDRMRRRAERMDGGSHHASLHPWQIDQAVFAAMDEERRNLLVPFYSTRGTNMLLDDFVAGEKIPREIAHCYVHSTGAHGFILVRASVPQELRECYTGLQPERNAVEWSSLQTWQQTMYVWRDDKYRLTDKAMAMGWAREI